MRSKPVAPEVYAQLIASARADDVAALLSLLDRGALVDHHYKPNYTTALQAAVSEGALGAVTALLGRGANPNYWHHGRGPLHEAVSAGRLDIIDLLLAHGASPHVRGGDGLSMAQAWAAEPCPDQSDRAAWRSRVKQLDTLRAHGLNVNQRNEAGETALMTAVLRQPDPAMLQLLVDRGADLFAYNAKGLQAVHLASVGPRTAHLRFLATVGASVDARDWNGNTPLFMFNYLETGDALIELGADIDARNLDGDTPLLHRLKNGAGAESVPHDVELLVIAGASLDAENHLRETPRSVARAKKLKAVEHLFAALDARAAIRRTVVARKKTPA